jgi:hypothetical protein
LTKYKKKKGEAQMKAVVYEEYAPDDDFKRILQVKDVEDPKPKPNKTKRGSFSSQSSCIELQRYLGNERSAHTGPLAAHFRL